MINVEKTVVVAVEIPSGTYKCRQFKRGNGKTMNDTRFDFVITEGELKDQHIIKFVNNSKITWTDDNGNGWTSEDFFMNGLANQLCKGTVSYGDILAKLDNLEEIELYISENEGYHNVSSVKPKMQEVCEGLDI